MSCGFYVGGMKEKDLALAAMKPVLLATYGMAAEGLDIKTLTTLVLATPRTDIVQAVGRILRSEHQRPLIIDVIDTHDCFQRQWKKRLLYYRKNEYTVKLGTSRDCLDPDFVYTEDKVKPKSRVASGCLI